MIAMTLRRMIVCALVTGFAFAPSASAQTQIVSPEELQSAIVAATHVRQTNRDAVASFLTTPKAEKALRTARLDAAQVKAAVASLDDGELARLATRAQQAQADFAAGRISERDLLWILVGIAALILIIVAVD
ncbi:MAG TPA: hypothetical protein VN442_09310 [Bryobacteraceae bacterium]|nr:hypothetical protein [Bryobacteraceae bacterium]